MQDQPNELDSRPEERLRRLEASIERLASENTSLKLELATVVSALRENQFQHAAGRLRLPAKPVTIEPPSRPSMAPAAIVVMLATALLSWQLIVTPPADRVAARAMSTPSPAPVAVMLPAHVVAPAGTEPPVTPLVPPTIYKGTLSVNADAPGARVFVNRKDVGMAPVRVRNLRAGAHLVWVEHEGYRRWTRVVTVPAERVTRVSADLEPTVVEP